LRNTTIAAASAAKTTATKVARYATQGVYHIIGLGQKLVQETLNKMKELNPTKQHIANENDQPTLKWKQTSHFHSQQKNVLV